MTDTRILQVLNQKEIIHNILLTELVEVELIKDSPDLLLTLTKGKKAKKEKRKVDFLKAENSKRFMKRMQNYMSGSSGVKLLNKDE